MKTSLEIIDIRHTVFVKIHKIDSAKQKFIQFTDNL